MKASQYFHRTELWDGYLRGRGYIGRPGEDAPLAGASSGADGRPSGPAASLLAFVLERTNFLPREINSAWFEKNARLMDETLSIAAKKGGMALVRWMGRAGLGWAEPLKAT